MPALDSIWFEKYTKLVLLDDISHLKPVEENFIEQSKKFLSGEIENPAFIYDIPSDLLESHYVNLIDLRAEIKEKEDNLIMRNLYLRKIEEQQLKIQLLQAVTEKDDQKFFETSKQLYKPPTVNQFKEAICILTQAAEKANVPLGDKLSSLGSEIGLINSCTFDLLLEAPTGKVLSDVEIKDVFNQALTGLEIPWQAVIEDDTKIISVQYGEKEINIPSGRIESASVIEGLVSHEVGVHLIRHRNGKISKLKLLSLGLDNYLEAEEGLALYYETLSSKVDLPGMGKFIGVALASGVGLARMRSFREVYEYLQEYFRLMEKITGWPNLDDVDNIAWIRSFRTFRGIHDCSGGACFTRDVSYWRGYLKMRAFMEAGGPETIRVMKGKYDPTNKEHVKVLDELGIE